MMDFHIKYKNVTSSEMNEHLKYIKDNKYMIRPISYEDAVEFGITTPYYFTAYLKVNFVNITLTYKRDSMWWSYKHNLSESDVEEDILQDTDPKNCYSSFVRYCHLPDLSGYYGWEIVEGKVKWHIDNLGGERYICCNKVGQRYHNVYGYDMNSAFLSACIDLKIPNTLKKPRFFDTPKENEVGFCEDGIPHYGPCIYLCKYVFPVIISPDLTRWAKEKYQQKNKAKTKAERQKFKDHGNLAIGTLARHNPFVRNCIIYASNKAIEKLIDENTLMSNTDSIVSLVERKDLKIGDGLGEFKLEHTGDFALAENGYQWNDGLPTISGFIKRRAEQFQEIVGRPYDILQDGNISDIFLPRRIDLNELKIYNNDIDNIFAEYLRRKYGKDN